MKKTISFLALTAVYACLSVNAQNVSQKFIFKRHIKDLPVTDTPTEVKRHELSANIIDFGLVEKNTSTTKSVLLRNTGNVSLILTDIASQNAVFSPFTNCTNLAPNENCAISVSFSPVGSSAYSSAVTFKIEGSSDSITVQGTSGEAVLGADMPEYSMTALAGESASVLVTLANTGQFSAKNAYLSAQGPVSITGNTCGTAQSKLSSIPPGGTCSVVINYSPTQEGTNSASFTWQAENTAALSRTVQLSATEGTISLNPQNGAASSIPDTELGFNSVKLYTVRNTGSGPVKNFKLVFTQGSGFSLDSATTCPSIASTLASGAECTIALKFSPTTIGSFQTSLSMQGLGSNLPLVQSVSGLGQKAIISNTALTFPATNAGSYSESTTTITNTGNLASTNTYVSISGAEYSIVENFCGSSATPVNITAGASCTVKVRFSPVSSIGTVSGSLTVNAPKATQTVTSISLSAVSNAAVATLTNTGALAWGTVARNSSPATKSWNFRNDGNTVMTITPVGLATPFSVSSNNCSSVAAGATCSIAIAVSTSATYTAGAKTITLTVNGKSVSPGLSVNATINPATMSITGATYGANLGLSTNNRLSFVKSYCEGQSTCTIPADTLYSPAAGGDPSPGNAKDLRVNYTCGGVVQPQYIKAAEAGFGATTISCP